MKKKKSDDLLKFADVYSVNVVMFYFLFYLFYSERKKNDRCDFFFFYQMPLIFKLLSRNYGAQMQDSVK